MKRQTRNDGRVTKLRVLLMEDDDADALLVNKALKDVSHTLYEIQREKNLAAGLARINQEEFDVVLLDLRLPGTTEEMPVATVRAACVNLPIVVLSELNNEETAISAFSSGAEEYLTKDLLGGAVLSRSIRYAIQRRQTGLELKKLQDQAESASRSKTEFLANMSHEIRTPMTAILGFSEMLLGDDALEEAPPERVDAVKTIHRNGQYLLGLINDILDLSKIEAGKMDVEQLYFSPVKLINEVVELMKVRADGKGLQVETTFEHPIPEKIYSDPTRLRQIIVNLMSNAIKFAEHGKVSIGCRLQSNPGKSGQSLEICVKDQGVGMTEEQMEKLFRPFTQADNSTTRKFGGTGLGLTISKRLAQMLGGDIDVESKYGDGSRFSVLVDVGDLKEVKMLVDQRSLALSQAGAKQQESTKPRVQKKLDCRVLLVEDGPDNQRLIAFILRKAGIHVDLAENGKVGLDLAMGSMDEYGRRHEDERQPYDVVLMDMQMPVMDGYTATATLRSKGYYRPIIALTAHAMTGNREKCVAAGCDDFATKPVDRVALIDLIESWLGRYSSNHLKLKKTTLDTDSNATS